MMMPITEEYDAIHTCEIVDNPTPPKPSRATPTLLVASMECMYVCISMVKYFLCILLYVWIFIYE